MASGPQVGTAYVEIVPKLGGKGTADVGRQIESGIDGKAIGARGGAGILSGFKTSAVGVAVGNLISTGILSAVSAATDGIKAVVGGAFNNYADYEQLVGGVDKLFGDSSEKLQAYAAEAYRTSGMSANQYMEQVTSFSAALINDLGGDTEAAADMADMAMRLMSDNVNTFGSDAESVQNAIMGLSRENYTMLDNLKLGYAGTKAGMEELIADANAYAEANGLAADLSIDSFADMITAIEYVQRAQNIAGTTSSEAASTISGSLGMAKASWEDFLTALGNPDADIGAAFGNLAESLGLVAENAIPIVTNIFQSIGEAIPMALEYAINELPDQLLPMLEGAFATLSENASGPLADVFSGLGEAVEALRPAFDNVHSIIDSVVAFVSENMPMFEEIGGKIGEIAGIVGGILATAIETVSGVLEVVVPILLDIGEAVLPALSGALDFVIGALDFVAQAFEGLSGIIEVVSSWLRPLYEEIAPFIAQYFQELGNVLTELGDGFTQLGEMARNKMEQLQHWLSGMPDRILAFFSHFAADIGQKFESAKEKMKQAFEDAKSFIQGIPSAIVGFFSGLAADVGAKFEAVKEAITSPIEAAKDAVGNAIDAIRGFLSGTLRFPHIEVPHFHISGGELPWGIGGKGTPPSVSVSWYARGGIVDGATLIGAGEAGREAIIPLENQDAMQPFAEAVADSLGEYLGDEQLIDWLARNLGPIIEEWTPTMTKREMRRAVAYG